MTVTREAAIEAAKAELERRAFTPCTVATATLGTHRDRAADTNREAWTVVFVPVDPALRAIEPGEIWFVVDAESGVAEHFPLI